jgi:hypothetical protein
MPFYIIRRRNGLLKNIIGNKISGKVEVMERGGRRRKQLLDDPKENTEYWKLKEEARGRNMWVILFGRGCERVVRLIKE